MRNTSYAVCTPDVPFDKPARTMPAAFSATSAPVASRMASAVRLPSGREASKSKNVFGQSRSMIAIGSSILRPRGANTIRDVSAANTDISWMRPGSPGMVSSTGCSS